MKKIALINGQTYHDVHKETGKATKYVAKKVYSVGDKDAIRLLRQTTPKGKHCFGRVTDINPHDKPEMLAPEVFSGDVLGTVEDEMDDFDEAEALAV